MKNLKKVLLAFAMLFVVVLSTACSSKDATSTKTFVLDKNGLKTTVVYTYIEKEDKVIKQVTTNEGVYASLNRSKEDVQKILDSIAAKYQGIEGIKQSIDYQEDKFVETIEVDYENLDYEKSKVVMGTNFQDPKKVKISLKKSEETLIKAGYQEQK